MPQEDYTELRIIGKGSFGQVFLVKNKRDGKELVMKKMRIGNITDKEREGYHLEVKLLSQLVCVTHVWCCDIAPFCTMLEEFMLHTSSQHSLMPNRSTLESCSMSSHSSIRSSTTSAL